MTRLSTFCTRFGENQSGLALLEFAFSLPVFLVLSLTGAELTNYITTRMRLSQVSLQLADNAARIGSGAPIASKTITEADINDLLTGAGLQAGELDLYDRGRVIISSLEPDPAAGHEGKFMIRWQRCRGLAPHPSTYGDEDDNNLSGIGPWDKAVPTPTGVAMFAEVFYNYQPIIKTSLAPSTIKETASMMVRDRRDTSDDSKNADGTPNNASRHPKGVYKVEGVTPSKCNAQAGA